VTDLIDDGTLRVQGQRLGVTLGLLILGEAVTDEAGKQREGHALPPSFPVTVLIWMTLFSSSPIKSAIGVASRTDF